MMLQIIRYTPERKSQWDAFVANSRNATFQHYRDYMDYHSDRFTDHSLLVCDAKGKLVALMPANENEGELFSHGGLTYGGLLLGMKSGISDVMAMLQAITDYMRKLGLKVLHYKQIPMIYHRYPSEEEEYALWRMGAGIEVCNIATTVSFCSHMEPRSQYCRRVRLRQSMEYGFELVEGLHVSDIWQIVEDSLMAHHQARPTHTLAEMELLASRFPDNICCYGARGRDGRLYAGVVAYVCNGVVHSQYGHATLEGYEMHAMDFLYFALLNKFSKDGVTRYFDFGTSNEQCGRYLNEALAAQKEGFGGRGITYKQWKLYV